MTKLSTHRLVITAALAGLLVSNSPMLRAEADADLDDFITENQTESGFIRIEDLYEFLREYFSDDEEDDEEDTEDEEGEELESNDFDDEEDPEDDAEEEDADVDEADEDEASEEDDFEDDGDEEDTDEEDSEEEDSDEEDTEEEESDEEDLEDSDDDSDYEETEEQDSEDDSENEDTNEEDFDNEAGECSEDEECEDEGETATDEGFGFINDNTLPNASVLPVTVEQANEASRFLSQATLGANYALITQVADMGAEAWLDTQFQETVGYTMPYASYLLERIDSQESEAVVEQLFETQGVPETYFYYAWWTEVMTSPDLVRQRVATALSEIFVISNTVEEIGENPVALATFYDTLLQHSFGNFRDLLRDVTLNPAMGIYLSHFQNAKANPDLGTFPDENYAREVMQLFSIGLFELNDDGSQILDGSGQPIPTYDNNTIREFAKVFTGLGNGGDEPSFDGIEEHYPDMTVPMVMYDAHHDTTAKQLLNGTVLPGGQSGMADIEGAIDNLFNHPNAGPFIGRLLIQRLVTSNPSPAYIARVSSAFNGDGGTPRGDMQAVIRAILLDPEATNPPNLASDTQGRLREPMLRAVHLARAFNAESRDRTFNDVGYLLDEATNQYIFNSPSVFNFFQPGYAPLGEITQRGLVAPEFQITSASSIIGVKNYLSWATSTEGPLEVEGQSTIPRLNLTAEVSLSTSALMDRLDTVLTYGTMTQTTRAAIESAIDPLEGDDKVRTAIYLIMISPDYTTAI